MIPQKTLKDLYDYIFNRISPKPFLRGCIENRMSAIIQADNENVNNIKDIMLFIFNYIPWDCWGNLEKVQDWLDGKIEISENDYKAIKNAFINNGLDISITQKKEN